MRIFAIILLVSIGCSLVMSRPDLKFQTEINARPTGLFSSFGNFAGSVWGRAKDTLNTIHEGANENVLKPMGNFYEAAKDTFNSVVGKSKNAAEDGLVSVDKSTDVLTINANLEVDPHVTYDAAKPELNANLGSPINIASDILKTVADKSISLVDAVKSEVDSKAKDVLDKSISLVDGVKSEVDSKAKDVLDKLNKATEDLKSNVNLEVNPHLKYDAAKPELNANLGSPINIASDIFKTGADKSISLVDGVKSEVDSKAKDVLDKSISLVDGVKSEVDSKAKDVLDKLNKATDDLKNNVNLEVNPHLKYDAAKPELNANLGSPINIASDIFKTVADKSISLVDGVKSEVDSKAKDVLDKSISLVDGVKSEVDSKAKDVLDKSISLVDGVKSEVDSKAKDVLDKSISLVDGVKSEVDSKAKDVLDKLNKATHDLKNNVNLEVNPHLKYDAAKPELNANLGSPINIASDIFKTGADKSISLVDGVKSEVDSKAKDVLDKSISLVDGVKSEVDSKAKDVLDKLNKATDDLKNNVNLEVNPHLKYDAAKPELNANLGSPINIASDILKTVADKSISLVDGVKSEVDSKAKDVLDKSISLVDGVKSEVDSKAKDVLDKSISFVDGVKSEVDSKAKDVLDKSISLVDGGKSEVDSKAKDVLDKLNKATEDLKSNVNLEVNPHLKYDAAKLELNANLGSPINIASDILKTGADKSISLVDGVKSEVDSKAKDVSDKSISLVDGVKSEVDSKAKDVLDKSISFLDGVKSEVDSKAKDVLDKSISLVDGVKSEVDSKAKDVLDKSISLVDGVKSEVDSKAKDVLDKLNKATDDLKSNVNLEVNPHLKYDAAKPELNANLGSPSNSVNSVVNTLGDYTNYFLNDLNPFGSGLVNHATDGNKVELKSEIIVPKLDFGYNQNQNTLFSVPKVKFDFF